MVRSRPLLILTVLFVVRLVIASVHGHAHDELSVPLALWQDAFVWSVIVVGPLIAIVWLWARPIPPVAWSLAAMLAAGWVFGLYFHFGPMNPDHVTAQPPGHGASLFFATALGLALVEPLTALAAVWLATTLTSWTGSRDA